MNTRSISAGAGAIALLLASMTGAGAQADPSSSPDVVGPLCVSVTFADGLPTTITAGVIIEGDPSMLLTILPSGDCAPIGDSVAPVAYTAYEVFSDYVSLRQDAASALVDDMPDSGLEVGWYKDLRSWANSTTKHLETYVVAPCYQEEYDAAIDWTRKVNVVARAGVDAITAYDKGSYTKALRLMEAVSPLIDEMAEARDYLDGVWDYEACEAVGI